jgi:hypothetical protein
VTQSDESYTEDEIKEQLRALAPPATRPMPAQWVVILARDGFEPQAVGPFNGEAEALDYMACVWRDWPVWAFVPVQLQQSPSQPQPWSKPSHLRRALDAHREAGS